jgi:hypothetical protein
MGLKNARTKPDIFDANAEFVALEGTSFVFQNGVMFESVSNSRVDHATTYQRTDGVSLIVGNRGYSRSGKFLGTLDAQHGNALIPGTAKAAAPKAPVVPKAPANKKATPKAPEPEAPVGDADADEENELL